MGDSEMSKGRSAFRLHTAGGQGNPRSTGDTMAELIREAYRQNSKETNQRAAASSPSFFPLSCARIRSSRDTRFC